MKVCSIKEVDTIVTDTDPGEIWREKLKDAGVELIFE